MCPEPATAEFAEIAVLGFVVAGPLNPDNGIGMDAADAERIFDIFQRAPSAAAYPGTGIGLAICKKTIERHGGRIWAQSCVGKGMTFKLTFPTREAGAPQI
jgi:signal transduction histidine kinase